MGRTAFDDGLPRAAPATHGVYPDRIEAFLADARRLGVELNSLMVWRTGAVVAEAWWAPYAPRRRHMMHSATKSFLSAAVGLAIAEGRFALADRVLSFFPDKTPACEGPNLEAMTVEHLLTHTGGQEQGSSGSIWRSIRTSWIDEFFKIPVVHPPGTFFRYSSGASFMLSAILSRTTGQGAHAYLRDRLFDPLGIGELTWDVGPEDINPGGNGISCRTSDLLKLAILHLQGGRWGGLQVLPAGWVAAATTPKLGNPYGYHWWCGPGGAFYAYGMFGQFAVVFPEFEAAVAITAATPQGEETLRSLIWRHAPRFFGAEVGQGDGEPFRPPGLTVLPALAAGRSPRETSVNGVTFEAAPNADGVTAVELQFRDGAVTLRLDDARGVHEVTAGLGVWVEGDTSLSGAALHHGYESDRSRVIAGTQWLSPDRLEMTLQFVETSFRDRIHLAFEGAELRLDRSVNVNSAGRTRPTIIAHRGSPPVK
ncbi:MAG: beta-lactamase family protein [Proteobacteria bacterium]|nr:beta-lactamase family protein [Pseudomonadota bacterium]